MRTVIILIALVLVVVFGLSAYTIHAGQVGLKFRLGEIVESGIEPGLHWKIPFAERVVRIDVRVQTLEEEAARFLTLENENVLVDAFVKWRVVDPLRFYTAAGGNPALAEQRLSELVSSGLRAEFSRRELEQVVFGERGDIPNILAEELEPAAEDLGIELVDVRIQQVELPPQAMERVFTRMQDRLEREARLRRAAGEEEATQIRAVAERERAETLARALRDAQIVRGRADAEAANIYAEAYERDADFFGFYRSLQAYLESFDGGGDVLLLEPDDSVFFRYFDSIRPAERAR